MLTRFAQLASFREHLASFREHLASFREHLASFGEQLASFREHLASIQGKFGIIQGTFSINQGTSGIIQVTDEPHTQACTVNLGFRILLFTILPEVFGIRFSTNFLIILGDKKHTLSILAAATAYTGSVKFSRTLLSDGHCLLVTSS
jgi:hypothetical protein